MFKDKRYQEIFGVVLILISSILFLSLFSYNSSDYQALGKGGEITNIVGPLGSVLSNTLRSTFGLSSYMLVAIFILAGWAMMIKGTVIHVMEKIFAIFFLTISVSALLSISNSSQPFLTGGYVGQYLSQFLVSVFGNAGTYLIVGIMNLIGLILLGFVSLSNIIDYAGNKSFKNMFRWEKLNITPKKKENNVPLNNLDQDLNKNYKMDENEIPWIKKRLFKKGTKLPWIERILINNIISDNDNETDSLKYLEMSIPAAAEEVVSSSEIITDLPDIIDDLQDSKEPVEVIKNDIEKIKIDNYSDKEPFSFTDPDEDIYTENVSVEEHFEFDEQDESIDDNSGLNKDYIEENRIKSIDLKTENANINESPVEVKLSENDLKPLKEKKREIDKDEDLSRSEKLVFDKIPLNDKYIIPTDFLTSSIPIDTESWKIEVQKNSKLLVNTLSDFGIEARVVNVNRGPVITLYELQIAPGIKVNRIVGLADDIAMALAAYRVRIVAPIPGKSAIGVEIPNRKREDVTLGDLIKLGDSTKQKKGLKIALGKDILGKPIMLDLKKLPHLLIAGATGSGKSVCVNTIISSLVYNYDPNYVRFLLVDPKMVELQLYNGLPHLLTPVITEPFVAPNALKWAMYEMERRYRLLSELNTRDIDRYNEKVEKSEYNLEKLPFIVTIIDELADLMMVASKEIEGYITRIAQKARAVGIHLVLATQRPSVDIITGIIKANFPARIAFQVAQKTDSRTIIDQNGAEKLLGKGDMLYQSPMGSYPVRIQGAFISEDEIMKIVDHLSSLGEPDFIDIEESLFTAEEERAEEGGGDELFVEALKIIEETRKASASYLQRRLSIGYNRAARIIEQMEDKGYVGPQQGSKPREIYI